MQVQGNTPNLQLDFNAVVNHQGTQETNNSIDPKTVNLIIQINFSVDEEVMNKLLDMDVPGNQGTSEVSGALGRFENLSKAMVDIFQIMELIHMLSSEQKKAAREGRQADRDAQQAELSAAVDKMREAANFALASAIVTGVFTMGTGLISIKAGASGISSLKNDGSELNVQMVTNRGRIFDGVSSVAQGVGKMISGGLDWKSTNAQADQKLLEADAQKSESRAQSESEFMSNLQEVIRDMQQRLQSIQQSNAESFVKASAV